MKDICQVSPDERQRALDAITKKKKTYGSSEFLSADAKERYDLIISEMADRPELTKIMRFPEATSWEKVVPILLFMLLKKSEEILRKLEDHYAIQ